MDMKMDTILQLTRRLAQNGSPTSCDLKYSPTDSLKMSSKQDNKRIERRKPNWTEAENVFLLDQFALHKDILTCKATDASTNLRKQEVWRLICGNLNQHNTLVRRTPAEVRRKWKNLVTAAKKELWEMRHQIHVNGGNTNGRKLSDLSQRVLHLHSGGNMNSHYNSSSSLLGALVQVGGVGGQYGGASMPLSKYKTTNNNLNELGDDKGFIPAHFTPIVTLSESNNNHINLMGENDSGPPSPLSEEDENDEEGSSGSRNAAEHMSDSGIYEQEGIDLRVNRSANGTHQESNSRERRLFTEDEPMDDVDLSQMTKYRSQHHGTSQDQRLQLASYIERHFSHAQQLMNLRNTSTNLLMRRGNEISTDNANVSDRQSQQDPESRHFIGGSEEPQITGTPLITDPNGLIVNKAQIVLSSKEAKVVSALYTERLRLQIDILRLRKQKLIRELQPSRHGLNGKYNGVVNRILYNGIRRKRLIGTRKVKRLIKKSKSKTNDDNDSNKQNNGRPKDNCSSDIE